MSKTGNEKGVDSFSVKNSRLLKSKPSKAKCEVQDDEAASCLNPPSSRREISPQHMKLWFDMAIRDHGSYAKLLWSLVNWSMDTFPLLATITLILIDKNNPSATRDIKWTVLFHMASCFVRLLIDVSNPHSIDEQDGNQSQTLTYRQRLRNSRTHLYIFLANVFMVLKPYRYVTGYYYRNQEGKSVRNQLRLRRPLTREEIESVISINKRNLTDQGYNIIEVFVQTLPMALLQLYILFQNNQSFRLCSRADASRLFMFIFCIFSSAKSASDYAWHYNNYLKSLHFLYFYDTGHPINLQSQNQLSYIFNLLCNTFLLVHRFYCISFFLAVSEVLAGIYLSTLLISQWVLIKLFPSALRIPFENPTFGSPTIISATIDRWINLFTNHMVKYTWLTFKSFNICKLFNTRLPLSLLQIFPFFCSMGAVFGASYIFGSDWEHYELLRSIKVAKSNHSEGQITIDENVLIVPCTNFSLENDSVFLAAVGNFLFQTHQKASNRFLSFKDIFGVIHFLPFSMYFYLCCSITYSYYLAWFGLNDPMFPVKTALEFWHFLIKKFSEGGSHINVTKCQLQLRKLMILTIIEDTEFYRLYRRHNFLCFKCNFELCTRCKSKTENNYWNSIAEDLVHSMTETGSELETKLNQVFLIDHSLKKDFKTLLDTLLLQPEESHKNIANEEVDKKLFLLFFVKFDNRMRDMTSFRIKRTFNLLSVGVNKCEV